MIGLLEQNKFLAAILQPAESREYKEEDPFTPGKEYRESKFYSHRS